METPIKAMYQAAKNNIPAQGARVVSVANTLQEALSDLDRQASYAGDPAALVSLLHVGGDVHQVLGVAVESLDSMAAALVATANHYVATDSQAQADYNNLSGSLQNAPLPDHQANDLANPEESGHHVENPPYFPGPPGGGTQVDPSETPGDPEQEQEDREDQEPDMPDIPIPELEW